jgi:hypothetical protein
LAAREKYRPSQKIKKYEKILFIDCFDYWISSADVFANDESKSI